MSREVLNRILIIIMGLIAAGVVFYISSLITIRKPPKRRVREMIDDENASAMDRSTDKVLTQFGLSLEAWHLTLKWAKIGGNYLTWTVGGMFFRGLLLAVLAMLMILLFKGPALAWFITPVMLVVPYVFVRGKSEDAKRQVKRLLPETVTVIAAEMDAGSTAAQAVSRAAELPSSLGKILYQAVGSATQSGRAMFSHGSTRGVLVEEIESYQMPELTRFARQLDRVALKGVDAPRVMVDIAKGLAREYKSHVQQTAANMDNELLIPMTLFFFLPFIVSILMPIMSAFTSAFK